MDNLTLTDYIFLFITLVSTLFGFARGFLREIFTILNLVLAALAAQQLFPMATELLGEKLKDPMWVQGAAGLGSYVVAWVVIAIVNSFVLDALKFLTGGFLDRLLGSALGIARGALIVIGVFLGATITVNAQNDDSKLPAWLKEAKSLNYIKIQSEYVVAMMPEQFQEFYKNQSSTISEELTKNKSAKLDESATKKLQSMGFDESQILTFQTLLNGLGDDIDINDLKNFDESTIKMVGEQVVEEYEDTHSGKNLFATDDIEQVEEISSDKLESLKQQLESIEVKDAW